MITRLDQISKSKMLAVGACGISCGSENKGGIDNESGTEDGSESGVKTTAKRCNGL